MDAERPVQSGLMGLNNAQRGSFGEFIFARLAATRGMSVAKQHRDRADFLVDDTPVDVKTTIRGLTSTNMPPLRPFHGRRVGGVSYAVVEFVAEGARVSRDGVLMSVLSWEDLVGLWDEWRSQPRANNGSRRKAASAPALSALRDELTSFFAALGLTCRVLYRTCQAEFGNEAPANLIPSVMRPRHVTVYLDFRDSRISRANLRRVIAFPDERCASLPSTPNGRLHLEKVDLDSLPSDVVFSNLDDLMTRFGGQVGRPTLGSAADEGHGDC
jgi:hypothetical protein